MILLNIGGGIALILFGIRFLRKGLERLMGFGLHSWLESMAKRPMTAAAAGTAFGTIAPSSTAQTLLTLQLLNAGKLPAESMLAFLLGANVGITVTIQLIAFRLSDYYSVPIVVGLVLFQFMRNETVRGIGQTILGLGFIFLAMSLIAASAAQLIADPDFMTVLKVVVNHPAIMIVFAAGLTFCTQSSTAAIGLGLALGETPLGSMQLLIPFVLGANLGLGLTSLAAGFPTWDGRRLAASNLLLKGIAIGLCLLFLHRIEAFFAGSPGSLARQAANFHTLFNLAVLLAGILVGAPLGRFMQGAIKPADAAEADRFMVSTHLDPQSLGTPAFALANASRETLRLADEVRAMLEGAWRALMDHKPAIAKEVRLRDDRVDEMNTSIKVYLSQIPAEAMTPRENQLQFGLLNFSSQLESIGDIVDKSLCSAALKHAGDVDVLDADDKAALESLFQKVLKRMDGAISVLSSRDRTLARQFLNEGDELKDWCIQLQKSHYQRLSHMDPKDVASSEGFIDLVNILRRISGQLNTIGHTFVMTRVKAERPATD